MRYIVRTDGGSPDDRRVAIFIFFGLLLALGYAWVPGFSKISIPCLIKWTVGIDCPGCGMTRAATHLARGDIRAAVLLNPLVIFLAGWAAYRFLNAVSSILFRVRFCMPASGCWVMQIAFLITWAAVFVTRLTAFFKHA